MVTWPQWVAILTYARSFFRNVLHAAEKCLTPCYSPGCCMFYRAAIASLGVCIQCVSVDSASLIIYPEIKATEVTFSALKRYLCSFYFRIDNETGGIHRNTLYIRKIKFRTCFPHLLDTVGCSWKVWILFVILRQCIVFCRQ